MTDTRTADLAALLGGGSSEDRLAALHFLTGAGFLVAGGAVQLLAVMALRFSGMFPLSFGRLEPIANLILMIGFAVVSLIGGVYYVLPRLTGARLWGEPLARLALLGIAGLTGLGVLAIAFGFGDGTQPLGLPWWLDVPLLGALSVPALVTIGTIRQREELRSFVTLWFAMGGVVWLPLLYLTHLVTELPSVSAVASSYAQVLFSAGFVTMVVVTLGTGLVYYTVVKELDVPLASRQLALVGFWSLGFAAGWWGAAQLVFGPGPDWVAGVAAALGLAFPIGAITNAANVSLTLEGSWVELPERPGVLSGLLGLYVTAGVALVASFAGFRSVAAVTANTGFWEAVEYVSLNGISLLLVAGVSFAALPRLVGRKLETVEKARRFQRLAVAGSVGILVSLGAAGVLAGYSWVGGSNSAAYIDAGEGWAAGLGSTYDALVLVALLFGVVLFLAQLRYAGLVFGTVTRGAAGEQEVLVARDADDE